jgi:hypothetical protein
LFRELQKNILPKYGTILRLVKQPGQAGTKKELACPGNYKIQITNYKQTTIPKLQITNKEEPFGQILYAFGEEHKIVSFIKPARAICNFGHCNLEFVCNLYFVFCNF